MLIHRMTSIPLSLLIAFSGVLAAQEPIRRLTAASAFTPPPRTGVIRSTSLTLQDVLAAVLAANKDIQAIRIDQQSAIYDVRAARGVFDPRIGANSYIERSVTPVASLIGGGGDGSLTQHTLDTRPQLTGLLPWIGGAYQIGWASSRVTTNDQFTTLNPQFPTALTLSYTQPLLRGLRFDQNRRNIEVAKKNLALTNEQFRQRVIDVTRDAVDAYWELVFATRNLELQARAVDLAQAQAESIQRTVNLGIRAPIEVVEAATQVATYRQNFYTAQEELTRAENVLKTLMLENRSSPIWSSAIKPATPMELTPPLAPLADAIAEALAGRPELAQVKISGEINKVDVRLSREQAKPQVDFVASYSAAGLAGQSLSAQANPFTKAFEPLLQRIQELSSAQGLPPLPPLSLGSTGGISSALIGGYGQSLSNLSSLNFPTARAGLNISFPLGNRTAKANLGARLAEARRIDNRRERVEQLIVAEVRNSMQALESGKARLEAATAARHMADEQYESEQRQIQAGISTVFLLLQRQSTMVTTQNRELRAEADLCKAINEFQRVTARILDVRDIKIGTGRPQP